VCDSVVCARMCYVSVLVLDKVMSVLTILSQAVGLVIVSVHEHVDRLYTRPINTLSIIHH